MPMNENQLVLFNILKGYIQANDSVKFKSVFHASQDLLNAQDDDGNTLLIHALKSAPEIAKHLLDKNADVLVKNKKLETPLSIAEAANNKELSVRIADKQLQLEIAEFYKTPEETVPATIQTLAKKYFFELVIPYVTTNNFFTMPEKIYDLFLSLARIQLMECGTAQQNGQQVNAHQKALPIIECFSELLEAPLDKHNNTVLIWAANNGDLENLEKLLKLRADINKLGNEGKTARGWAEAQSENSKSSQQVRENCRQAAIRLAHEEFEYALSKFETNPKASQQKIHELADKYLASVLLKRYRDQERPLSDAQSKFVREIAEQRLKKYQKLTPEEITDRSTMVKTSLAIIECFRDLIDTRLDRTDNTTLTWAASQGDQQAVNRLVELGANTSLVGNGNTAQQWAEKNSKLTTFTQEQRDSCSAIAKQFAQQQLDAAFKNLADTASVTAALNSLQDKYFDEILATYKKHDSLPAAIKQHIQQLALQKLNSSDGQLTEHLKKIIPLFPQLIAEPLKTHANQTPYMILVYRCNITEYFTGELTFNLSHRDVRGNSLYYYLTENNNDTKAIGLAKEIVKRAFDNFPTTQPHADTVKDLNNIAKYHFVEVILPYYQAANEQRKEAIGKYIYNLALENITHIKSKSAVFTTFPNLVNNCKFADDNTLLHQAAIAGDFAAVTEYIKDGANPLSLNKNQKTASQLTSDSRIQGLLIDKEFEAAKKDVNLAKIYLSIHKNNGTLLAKKTTLILDTHPSLINSIINQHGDTLLLDAAYNGNFELVKKCIAKGADVNIKDNSHSRTALDWAVKRYWEKYYAYENATNYYNIQYTIVPKAIEVAIKNNRNTDALQLLSDYPSLDIISVVKFALESNKSELFKTLITQHCSLAQLNSIKDNVASASCEIRRAYLFAQLQLIDKESYNEIDAPLFADVRAIKLNYVEKVKQLIMSYTEGDAAQTREIQRQAFEECANSNTATYSNMYSGSGKSYTHCHLKMEKLALAEPAKTPGELNDQLSPLCSLYRRVVALGRNDATTASNFHNLIHKLQNQATVMSKTKADYYRQIASKRLTHETFDKEILEHAFSEFEDITFQDLSDAVAESAKVNFFIHVLPYYKQNKTALSSKPKLKALIEKCATELYLSPYTGDNYNYQLVDLSQKLTLAQEFSHLNLIDKRIYNRERDTLLIKVASLGYNEYVKACIDLGADVGIIGAYDCTALQRASWIHDSGNQSVDALVNAEYQLALKDPSFAKRWLATNNSSSIKLAVIKQHNLIDPYGNQLLLSAVYNNELDVVKELIKLGANVTTQIAYGVTVRQWAIKRGFNQIAEELAKAALLAAIEKNQATTIAAFDIVELFKQHKDLMLGAIHHVITKAKYQLFTDIVKHKYLTYSELAAIQKFLETPPENLGIDLTGYRNIIKPYLFFAELAALDDYYYAKINEFATSATKSRIKNEYLEAVRDKINTWKQAGGSEAECSQAYLKCINSKTAQYMQFNIFGNAVTASKLAAESVKHEFQDTSNAVDRLNRQLDKLNDLIYPELSSFSMRFSHARTKKLKEFYIDKVQVLIDESPLSAAEKRLAYDKACNSACATHRAFNFLAGKETGTFIRLNQIKNEKYPSANYSASPSAGASGSNHRNPFAIAEQARNNPVTYSAIPTSSYTPTTEYLKTQNNNVTHANSISFVGQNYMPPVAQVETVAPLSTRPAVTYHRPAVEQTTVTPVTTSAPTSYPKLPPSAYTDLMFPVVPTRNLTVPITEETPVTTTQANPALVVLAN